MHDTGGSLVMHRLHNHSGWLHSLVVWGLLVTGGLTPAWADTLAPVIERFSQTYCLDCHGPPTDAPEADFSLSGIMADPATPESLAAWQKVLQAIESHDMPPEYMQQPSRDERAQMARSIRNLLASPSGHSVGHALPRRLTRLEYNNTVRDLLGLETDVFIFSERLPFDKSYFSPGAGEMPETLTMTAREYGARYPVLLPDAGLPPDSRAQHGFTNRGDAQNLSASVLEQYLSLAHEIAFHPNLLSAASRAPELFPTAARSKQRSPTPPATPQQPPAKRVVNAQGVVAPQANVARTAAASRYSLVEFNERLAEAYDRDRGGVESFESVANSTIPSGSASLQVAYGLNANRVVALEPSAELWAVGFSSVNESSGNTLLTNKQQGDKQFALRFIRSDDQSWHGPTEVGLVLLSRQGQSGAVRIAAQCSDGTEQSMTVEMTEGAGADNVFLSFAAPSGSGIRSLEFDGSQFAGPYVAIDDLAFIVDDQRSDAAAVAGRELPDPPSPPVVAAARRKPDVAIASRFADLQPRERIALFMQRAFRRPVEAAEVDRYEQIYAAALAGGQDEEFAMRSVLQGLLSSPNFLYVVHIGTPTTLEQSDRRLTDHELASRLSYFLWSSMPDDELFQLADNGKLSNRDTLGQQVQRMLNDDRCRELGESFFVEWLRLRELWSSQPDEKLFPEFYSGPMGKRTSARDFFGEALLAFETLVVENRSVIELLHADYGYVNGRVAKLYDFDPDELALYRSGKQLGKKRLESDDTWHRVRLPDARRGGVVTMGATLTLTSFPERTSPIKRGAWVLETIFNRPPPPPTVVVPDLEDQDDENKQLTIRQKVELHRADASCAVCHNRIDPPGFALENFDAIGRWRTEQDAAAIDATGSLPGLGAFDGPAAFKELLLQDRQRFVHGFTEHLLSYALSRKLEYFDVATIESIERAAAAHDFRIREVITAIVLSDAFQSTTRP